MKHEEIIEELRHVPVVTETQRDAISRACRFLRDTMQEDIKQPQPLKIEVGGEYQTRDGREVRLYATDGSGDYSVHGAILMDEGWVDNNWTIEGKYHLNYNTNDDDNDDDDLIPKPKNPLSFTGWYYNEYMEIKPWHELSHFKINEIVNKYTEYVNNCKS